MDIDDPGIEPMSLKSPALASKLPLVPPGKLHLVGKYFKSVWNSKNILNELCYGKSYDKIADLCMGEKLRQT